MSVSNSLGGQTTLDLPQGPLSYRERGRGEPVLLLHGLLVNGDQWRSVVPLLAKDLRCITPDMPFGAHADPMHATTDLSMAGVADLTAAFLDRLGVERVTLVGNDAGGVLCQVILERHPDRVERLVFACCDAFEDFPPNQYRFIKYLPYLPGSTLLIARAMLVKRIRRSPFGHAPVMRKDPEPEVVRSYLRPPLRRPIRRDISKVLRAVSSTITLKAARHFGECQQPVLVAWAGEDKLFDPSTPARLVRAFPNASLQTIDSRAYIPEDAPVELAEAILRFIKANPAGSKVSAETPAGAGRS